MPYTPLENYSYGSESHEGPALERALALGFGSLALLSVIIACAVFLHFIGFISATILFGMSLLLSIAITANGIRNIPAGFKVIEIDDE